MIIAIAGHNRVGKSSMAKQLKQEYTALGMTAEIYSFASVLRNEIYSEFDKEWLEKKSPEARKLLRAWGDARRSTDSMYFVKPLIAKMKILQNRKDHVSIIDDVYHVNEFCYLNFLPNVQNILVQRILHRIPDEDFVFESVRQTEVIQGFYNHKNMEVLLDVDRNIEYSTQELANFVKNTQEMTIVDHILDDPAAIGVYMIKAASRFVSNNPDSVQLVIKGE